MLSFAIIFKVCAENGLAGPVKGEKRGYYIIKIIFYIGVLKGGVMKGMVTNYVT